MSEQLIELLPVPEVSTGLCRLCRADAALPDGDFCGDCADELEDHSPDDFPGYGHRGDDR